MAAQKHKVHECKDNTESTKTDIDRHFYLRTKCKFEFVFSGSNFKLKDDK